MTSSLNLLSKALDKFTDFPFHLKPDEDPPETILLLVVAQGLVCTQAGRLACFHATDSAEKLIPPRLSLVIYNE